MNKIIITTIVFALLILSACSSPTGDATIKQDVNVQTQTQDIATGGCPRGIHDDTYPGICVLYKDENHNGECDYGE